MEAKEYKTAFGLLSVYNEFSNSTDFVFLCALIYMHNGYFNEAICEFEKAITRTTFKMEGVNSYLAWYNMGVIYECTGNVEMAKYSYKKCGEYMPALKGIERIG